MKALIKVTSILVLFLGTMSFAETQKTVEIGVEKKTSYFYENFGRVIVGSTRYARYTVKNTGTTPLPFESAVIYGSFDFDGYHSCKNGLEPQKSCWIEVRYWPMFEGWDTGTFLITFDKENKIRIDLSGEGYRL